MPPILPLRIRAGKAGVPGSARGGRCGRLPRVTARDQYRDGEIEQELVEIWIFEADQYVVDELLHRI
jgi:hypothetical protein